MAFFFFFFFSLLVHSGAPREGRLFIISQSFLWGGGHWGDIDTVAVSGDIVTGEAGQNHEPRKQH